jgi:hypothetical protein
VVGGCHTRRNTAAGTLSVVRGRLTPGAGRRGALHGSREVPMGKILVLVSALLLVFGVMAGSALAQVPPHNHFLTVPGTGNEVQVAPNRCELGEKVQRAFLEFHVNVHTGTPAETGGLTITPVFC